MRLRQWFMDDVAARLANRVQLTTDGHKAYLEAVEGAFGPTSITPCWSRFTAPRQTAPGRYSPAECTGAIKRRSRASLIRHISTSYSRALQPHDADAQSPLHSPDECVLQEIREPCAHGRHLAVWYNLAPHSQDASGHPRDGPGLSQTVMDWSDIVEAMDGDEPKPELAGRIGSGIRREKPSRKNKSRHPHRRVE